MCLKDHSRGVRHSVCIDLLDLSFFSYYPFAFILSLLKHVSKLLYHSDISLPSLKVLKRQKMTWNRVYLPTNSRQGRRKAFFSKWFFNCKIIMDLFHPTSPLRHAFMRLAGLLWRAKQLLKAKLFW